MSWREGLTAMRVDVRVIERGIEVDRRASVEAWRRAGRRDRFCSGLH